MAAPDPSEVPVVCAGVVVADHLSTPIDHLPAAGELVAADNLVLNLGGCASSTAVDLVRLGVEAVVCGKVGDDLFGRFVAESLRAHGVDIHALRVDLEQATGQTLIVNVRGEDRRFIHSFGANAGLSVADIDSALNPLPRVLLVGGYLILPGLDAEGLTEQFARVRRGGGQTILDVAIPGPGDYLPQLRPVLAETDIFLPNAQEAALILGETDPVRQALAFRDLGARRVVITQGAHGAVALSDTLRVRLGCYPTPFVDGTGGGDAFNAGYIAGLLDGLDELDCLKLASAVGASCVRAVGTTSGVFTRAEADEFLARHDLPIEQVP